MISRVTIALSGVLSIVAAWMPWLTVLESTQNGFMGDMAGNPGIFFVLLGSFILIMGIINKKWSAIIAILFAALVCMLGLNYYFDSTVPEAIEIGAKVGSGIYTMIFGGLLGMVGGFIRLFKKRAPKNS